MACIDVNRAPAAVLAKLPGIGKKLAEAIISHRQGLPDGRFTTVAELAQVRGIGRKRLSAISELVHTGDGEQGQEGGDSRVRTVTRSERREAQGEIGDPSRDFRAHLAQAALRDVGGWEHLLAMRLDAEETGHPF